MSLLKKYTIWLGICLVIIIASNLISVVLIEQAVRKQSIEFLLERTHSIAELFETHLDEVSKLSKQDNLDHLITQLNVLESESFKLVLLDTNKTVLAGSYPPITFKLGTKSDALDTALSRHSVGITTINLKNSHSREFTYSSISLENGKIAGLVLLDVTNYLEDYIKPIDLASRKISLLANLIMIAILVITFIFLLITLKKIKLLTQHFIKIGKGATDSKLVIKTNDEFRILADEINKTNELRKEHEKEIVSSNIQLKRLMDSTPAIIFTCLAYGNLDVTSVTENIKDKLGYSADEFINIPGFWAMNIHPDDKERVLSGLPKLFEIGSLDYEYRFRHKDGNWHWIHDSLKLINDGSGNPLEIVGYLLDITDRKLTENTIMELNERFKLVAKATNDCVYDWNIQTGRIWWGDLSRLFNYPSDIVETDVNWWEDRIHPDDYDFLLNSYQKALDDKLENWQGEYRFKIVDDSYVNIYDRGFILYDNDNNPLRWIGSMMNISDRKKKEEQLRFQSTILEQIENSVVALDPEGKIIYWNNFNEKISHFLSDEVLGKNIFELPMPDSYKIMTKRLFNIFKKTDSWEGEYTIYNKELQTIIIYVKISTIKNNLGNKIGYLIVSNDITEKKAIEDELKRNEIKFRSLFDSSNDSILLLHNGIFIDCNAKTEQLLACNKNDIVGHSPLEFSPKEQNGGRLSSESAMEKINAVLTGEPQLFEWTLTRLDGSILETEIGLSRLEIDGEYFLQAVVRDITARKKAEEQIKIFALALKNSADCITITDAAYSITYVNFSFQEVYGYKQEEIVGQPIFLIHSENNSAELTNDIFSTLKRNQFWKGEAINKKKDGKEFPVLLSVAPLLNEKGEMIASVGIIRDITSQKNYELELKEAKERAESANNSKSDFLANISHELRTPLNGIIGMADLMSNTKLESNQERFIKNIKISGELLLSLVSEVLEFSKIESGKIILREDEFSLRNELSSLLKPQGSRAAEKGIELIYSVENSIPELLIGDSLRLQQIITNLVGNSIKFTNSGTITLRVEEESRDKEIINLHFVVSDTGIGIPKEKQELIFEAFEQADTSITRQFGGTGLGLSISSSIVHLFGGHIWVESQVNQGSDFHFVVPFKISGTIPTETFNPEVFQELRAMIVDDNPNTSELLRDIFKGWGMKAKIESNCEDALSDLKSAVTLAQPYQIIFLDLNLPGMNGFEFTEILKNHPDLNDIPIIMISKSHESSAYDTSLLIGIDAFITKPFGYSELLDTIQEVLQKHQTNREKPINITDIIKENILIEEDYHLPSLNILVAEDNEINQEILIELLKGKNHKVTISFNGKEAVDKLENSNYDLILMDIQMPVMDGITATQIIRQKEAGTGIHKPIIALSARTLKEDVEKCIQAGMDGFVSKPFRPIELFRVMRKVFGVRAIFPKEEKHELQLRIDAKSALDALDGNEKLLKKILVLFIEKSPGLMQELEQAIETGDWEIIYYSAHKLKGSYPIFIPESFLENFINFEKRVKEKDLSKVKEIFPTITNNFESMLELTTELCNEVGCGDRDSNCK